MASDRLELGATESYWLNGAFASKPIGDMLVWIREWNRSRPGDPIRLVGYQPENPVSDFAGLFGYLRRVAPLGERESLVEGVRACRVGHGAYESELDFIRENSERTAAGRPNFTPEERAACLDGLYAIQAYLETETDRIAGVTTARDRETARLRLVSLEAYVGVVRYALDVGAFDPLFANHHGFGFSNVVLARQLDGVLYLPRSARVGG